MVSMRGQKFSNIDPPRRRNSRPFYTQTMVRFQERDELGGLFGSPAEATAQTASAGWITAFCDGGSRGNPGPSGFGVHIEDETGKTLGELSEFLGKQTNNYAEYSGLLAALEFALREGHPRLRVVADSELMVKQIKGQYRVNSPDLRPLYDEAKRRIARLEKFRIEHVLRGKNKNADRLANLAMDRGIKDRGTKDQGMTRSPGAFRAAVQASSEPSAAATAVAKRALRGVVRGGVIQFVAGELPEGTLVEITPERS